MSTPLYAKIKYYNVNTCYICDTDPCGEAPKPTHIPVKSTPHPSPKPTPPKPTDKCDLTYDPNLYSKYKDGSGKIHCEKNSKYHCKWNCSDPSHPQKVPVQKYPGFIGCYETLEHCNPTPPPKPTPPKPSPPKCPTAGVIACVRNVDQDNRKVSIIKNMKTLSNNTAVDLCIDKGFLANDYTTDEEAFFATNENVVNDYLNHTNLLPDDRSELWVTVAKKIMNHQPLNQMEQRVRNLGDVLWCDLINQLKKLDKKRSDYESVFEKVVLIYVGRLR